uniref:Mitogen-activated protein kinase kinase kinase 15 n=1 Tax=Lygus hesperus TaxID=30085 RepID=A0A0A9XML2_LYGHE
MSAGDIDDESGEVIGYSFPSDIWSLGCVAMEMITNKPPFSHLSGVKGPAGLTRYITSLHDIPDLSPLFGCKPCLIEFVSACLHPDPLSRSTAKELLHLSVFSEGNDEVTNSAL